MLRHTVIAVVLVLLTFSFAPAPEAAEERPILTAAAAMKMVHGCLAKANSEGWLMHIAIIDNHGNLKAYHRMDDAQLLSQNVSMAKARSSAVTPRSTRDWGDSAFPDGGGPTAAAFVPDLIFFEGGLPIMTAGGYHIGGIGVSGDTGANDAVCAQTGIDAAAEDLR
tara:strand:- start:17 stop:514 length:498 start_codon:yes stop_codon:yes gene_type:complete